MTVKVISYGDKENLYNVVFDVNPYVKEILEVILLEQKNIQRFRDAGIDYDEKKIWVYTRTGSKYNLEYPNLILKLNPYFINSIDDKSDETYAIYYFKYPTNKPEAQKLQNLKKIMKSSKIPDWQYIFDNFDEHLKNKPEIIPFFNNIFKGIIE